MKNLINDYKNGLDEISVLLQELRAYTTIKGLDKKTVEDNNDYEHSIRI